LSKVKRAIPFVIIVGVLAAALLTAWYWKRSAPYAPTVAPLNASHPVSSGNTPKLGAHPPHVLVNPDAPVILEKFGDFECSACGAIHPVLKTIKSEFGPSVVIVFREFPLSHVHALAAAQAAEAAGLQGKFWEMHNLLYENQKEWHDASDVRATFEDYALRIGLRLDEFRQDVSSEMVSRRIDLDKERGYWIGVNSTPTVFLNGREVPFESLTRDKLKELIRAQILSGANH